MYLPLFNFGFFLFFPEPLGLFFPVAKKCLASKRVVLLFLDVGHYLTRSTFGSMVVPQTLQDASYRSADLPSM